MSDYGKILMSTANAVGASLKKKMGSLTGYAPVDWAETINKLGNKLPERTVSGAVCSFADGADDVPMSSVKASITAVQAGSGDPSPSNVREISGFAECDVTHTKKNLWGGGKMADDVVTAVNNSSRAYKGEDTNGKYLAISAGNGLNVPWYTNFKENTQYTLILKASKSNTATTTNIRFYYTDDSTSAISFPESPVSGTVYTIVATSTANKTIKQIEGVYNSGITYVYYNESGLFEGVLTASDYESYAGETIPVSFGGQTIYGGELNLTTGVLTVTHGIYEFDGTENFSYSNNTKTYYVETPSISMIKKVNNAPFVGLSSCFLPFPGGSWSSVTTNQFYVGYYSDITNGFRFSFEGGEVSDIATTMRGVTVCYELATPTTIQLTPEEVRSFLGTNNLWANTGDSEVTYFAQPNVPTEVLYKGQISTTSDYATANFTESVADDEEILVKVYCPARDAVDYKVIKVSDIGNGLNVGFNLHTTVNCTITKTSIASYQYSGDYYDIYADVLAYDSAIFN